MKNSLIEFKRGISYKMKNFFQKIWNKHTEKNQYPDEKKNEDISFQKEIREELQRKSRIKELQSEFEVGMIREYDLSENLKRQIIHLYDEQIDELDKKITEKRQELKRKTKIANELYQKAIDLKMNG